VLEPSASDFEFAAEKLKSHKSPGIDQIPTEMIKAGGRIIRFEICKFIISIWNKGELPEEWKESITVPIYKKGDKTDCSNYTGISLLPTMYKFLSNILLSWLTPHAEEIIGDHQCGFRHNRSTTDHSDKKNGNTINQLFIYFKNAYDSIWREVLYNILF